MSRTPSGLATAARWALVAAVLAWWSPTIALGLTRIATARLRFDAEMAAVDALFALHRDQAARRLLAGVVRRHRRATRAARERRLAG